MIYIWFNFIQLFGKFSIKKYRVQRWEQRPSVVHAQQLRRWEQRERQDGKADWLDLKSKQTVQKYTWSLFDSQEQVYNCI